MTDWAALVGPAWVASGGAADAVDGVVPARVVRPGSLAEVQTVVRAVAEHRQALVASGRGAHLDMGAPPARLDVLLRLDRLTRVVDHQAADMTVTVEAGCPLAALGAALGSAGQWLSLDPPRPEETTVGGLVAANLSGPLRASQGGVRDLLIGLRVVNADGAVVAGGGRVVKNVAGYDLPKLHVGALGSVGVIVEATFKVRPRPPVEEAVVVACRTAREAAETALVLRDSDAAPLWLQVAGAGGLPEGPGEGAAAVVGLGGIAEEVADARACVERVGASLGLRTLFVTDGAALRARLGAFAVEPAAAVLRAATLPSEVGSVMERLAATARERQTVVRCLADAATGVVRAALTEVLAVGPLVKTVRPDLERHGGTLVVERAVPDAKVGVDVWGDPGPGLRLMRGLKAAFDPGGIFSPGRYVGSF